LLHQGGRKYQIKGFCGTGAFAKLYKASIDGNSEETVALKVKDVSIIKIKPGFSFDSDVKFYSLRAGSKACISLGILHVPPA
jgi:hypothetical protein